MPRTIRVLAALLLLFVTAHVAADKQASTEKGAKAMNQFVIEREIEGAGKLRAEELRDISRQSRDVLESLGSGIQWVHSYVADDKLYCVYNASDADIIRRHAELGGFPANRISQVRNVIDPSTAD
jgi:hypothetical protein